MSPPPDTDLDAAPAPEAKPGYFAESERPLAALLFLLPLLIFYELGTKRWAIDPATLGERRIIAFNLLRRFFGWTMAAASEWTGRAPPPPPTGPLMQVAARHHAVVAVLAGVARRAARPDWQSARRWCRGWRRRVFSSPPRWSRWA